MSQVPSPTGRHDVPSSFRLDVSDDAIASVAAGHRLDAVFDAASTGTGVIDSDARFVYVNEALADLVGRLPVGLLGLPLWGLVHQTDAEAGGRELQRILQGVTPGFQAEMRHIHATGQAVWTQTSLSLIGDDRDAERARILVQVHDISKRRRAEREARRRAEDAQEATGRLEAVLASLGEGLAQLDAYGAFQYLNPIGERMLGYRLPEIKGVRMHELIHSRTPDGRPATADTCPLLDSIDSGVPHHEPEDHFLCKDDTFLQVEYTSTPLLVEGLVLGGVVAFRDITHRKRSTFRSALPVHEPREEGESPAS